jgi:tetratricopeptide (TPR) repeat protein
MHSLPLALFLAPVLLAQTPPPALVPPVRLKPMQVSPGASVSQTLGITTVKIDYFRPAVKGRVIWGELVPFGQVWRAGANEATVFTFSDAVKIGGKELPAGTYGFFAIPGKETWTLILNKKAKQWGAYAYKAEEDVLRLDVKPQAAPHQEYLQYDLQVAAPERLRMDLRWEKLAVGFDIEIDVKGLYWKHLEETLAQAPSTDWVPWYQAANYCLQQNVHLDKAMGWIDGSLKAQEVYRNLELKARLLQKAGKVAEAMPYLEKAIAAATAAKTPKEYLDGLEKARQEWSPKGK